MCQRVPRPGETWVFRRPGSVVDFDVRHGVVQEVTPRGFLLDPSPQEVAEDRANGISLGAVGLKFANGWEPFLCLDAGEAQEHPAPAKAKDTVVKLRLDASGMDKVLAKMRADVDAFTAAMSKPAAPVEYAVGDTFVLDERYVFVRAWDDQWERSDSFGLGDTGRTDWHVRSAWDRPGRARWVVKAGKVVR